MTSTRIVLAGGAVMLCALLASCQKEQEAPARVSAKKPAPEGIIAAVGDSLTAGFGVSPSEAYPALLERRLRREGRRWRVVNAGISGETSAGTLSRVDWILKLKPDIVVLETGANDGLRGLDPDLTYRNIDRTVTRLQGEGVVVVLAGMKALRNMGEPFRTEFEAIYPKLARKRALILIPFFLAGVAGDPALNQDDGVHPTAKGYRIITDALYPYLLQAIEREREKKKGR